MESRDTLRVFSRKDFSPEAVENQEEKFEFKNSELLYRIWKWKLILIEFRDFESQGMSKRKSRMASDYSVINHRQSTEFFQPTYIHSDTHLCCVLVTNTHRPAKLESNIAPKCCRFLYPPKLSPFHKSGSILPRPRARAPKLSKRKTLTIVSLFCLYAHLLKFE